MLILRTATGADGPFLAEVLALAVAWRPGAEPPTVLAEPGVLHYVAGWPRPGDHGLIAEDRGVRVGAAWWRFFRADDPGYGYVRDDIPELAVGVLAGHRGRGTGTVLVAGLAQVARQQGLPGVSLSVEPDNPAWRLYERLGFRDVGTDSTMCLRIPSATT